MDYNYAVNNRQLILIIACLKEVRWCEKKTNTTFPCFLKY